MDENGTLCPISPLGGPLMKSPSISSSNLANLEEYLLYWLVPSNNGASILRASGKQRIYHVIESTGQISGILGLAYAYHGPN